jgi:hypothetical protein
MSEAVDFVVRRGNFRDCAILPGRHSEATALAPGEVLVRIDTFALTANNVSYGAVGEMLGYWKFFPADDGWGRLPVWGFADVARSRHDALPVGERLYGYFPISTYLALAPDRVTRSGVVDASPHRAELPANYNRYVRVAADPIYDRGREGELAVFRPLFTTSFLLDHFLSSRDRFQARALVLSSASSKTALGLAYLLSRPRADRAEVIGLTSPGNREFVERTRYYDRVVTYDEIGRLRRDDAVFVDFAGNGRVVHAVHAHFANRLRHSAGVGLTHWERLQVPDALPGPAPAFFFAPDHGAAARKAWGAAAFQARVDAALQDFLGDARRWLRIVPGRGTAAVETVYRGFLEGAADPAAGHVLSL